VLVQNDLCTL